MLDPATPGALTGPNIVLCHLAIFFAFAHSPSQDLTPLLHALLLFITRSIYGVHAPPANYAAFRRQLELALASYHQHEPRKAGRQRFADMDTTMLWEQLQEMCDRCLDPAKGLRDLAATIDGIVISEVEELACPRGIQRRSLIGIHLRRVRLNIWKLDDAGIKRCTERIRWWYQGATTPQGISSDGSSDSKGISRGLMHMSELGEVNDRLQSYLLYQHALKVGDYSAALHHRFRFFDLYPQGSTRVLYQWTLLDLAAFHLRTGGLAESRLALKEALHLARDAEDQECIFACDSLMHRLEVEERGEGGSGPRRPGNADSAASLLASSPERRREADEVRVFGGNPWSGDLLWLADSQLNAGAPLLSVLNLVQTRPGAATNAYDVNFFGNVSATSVRPHSALARIWTEIGQPSVARVHREAASDGSLFPLQPCGPEVGLECARQGAQRLAEAARYDEAVAALLRPALVRSLDLALYRKWHRALLGVVWVKARRRGDLECLERLRALDPSVEAEVDGCAPRPWDEVGARLAAEMRDGDVAQLQGKAKVPKPRSGDGDEGGEALSPPPSSLRAQLLALRREADEMLSRGQPALAVEPALRLLSLASSRQLRRLALDGVLSLCEATVLGLRMPLHALRLLESDPEELPGGEAEVGRMASALTTTAKSFGGSSTSGVAMLALLAETDLERRGRAKYVYARALLGAAQAREEARRRDADGEEKVATARDPERDDRADREHALEWLLGAEQDFEACGSVVRQRAACTYLAALYDSLGRVEERDEAARRWSRLRSQAGCTRSDEESAARAQGQADGAEDEAMAGVEELQSTNADSRRGGQRNDDGSGGVGGTVAAEGDAASLLDRVLDVSARVACRLAGAGAEVLFPKPQ